MIQRRPVAGGVVVESLAGLSPPWPYSSPRIPSAGRAVSRWARSVRSTSVSASETGVMSDFVSTARSSAPKRAIVISSARSASRSARRRSALSGSDGSGDTARIVRVGRRAGAPAVSVQPVSGDLQSETVELLQRLIRFDTVNPPGNERPAIEHLERYCAAAGFACVVLADDPERPNLVATLGDPEAGPGHPVLCLLGHVDTVLADPSAWTHDPWSGDIADGYLWGR